MISENQISVILLVNKSVNQSLLTDFTSILENNNNNPKTKQINNTTFKTTLKMKSDKSVCLAVFDQQVARKVCVHMKPEE